VRIQLQFLRSNTRMTKHKSRSIGIIGGMSWESTLLYYRQINEGIKATLGGLHSARVIINSLDFAEIEALQHRGDWEAAGRLMNNAAKSLELAGAEFILIATNTMHKVAEPTLKNVTIPLLHIVDPTAEAIKRQGYKKIGLLGTGFTMNDDFYKGRMLAEHGLDVIVPSSKDQSDIHRIIYEELCQGTIRVESRDTYLNVVNILSNEGAEAVILGCTEITLLIQQQHTHVPLFDTTGLHAEAAVKKAIADHS